MFMISLTWFGDACPPWAPALPFNSHEVATPRCQLVIDRNTNSCGCKRRCDGGFWPDSDSPILVRQVRSLGLSSRHHDVGEVTRLTHKRHSQWDRIARVWFATCWFLRYQLAHCALIPSSLTMRHHFSASAFTTAPRTSGVCRSRGKASSPSSARRARTAGSIIASTAPALELPDNVSGRASWR
jgi:hypothetical protein